MLGGREDKRDRAPAGGQSGGQEGAGSAGIEEDEALRCPSGRVGLTARKAQRAATPEQAADYRRDRSAEPEHELEAGQVAALERRGRGDRRVREHRRAADDLAEGPDERAAEDDGGAQR